MSATDPGLPDAVQRMDDILVTDCRDEWQDRETLRRGYAEALAKAARSDVPDLIRQAKADAWEVGVETALQHAVRCDDGIRLTLRAPNPYREP